MIRPVRVLVERRTYRTYVRTARAKTEVPGEMNRAKFGSGLRVAMASARATRGDASWLPERAPSRRAATGGDHAAATSSCSLSEGPPSCTRSGDGTMLLSSHMRKHPWWAMGPSVSWHFTTGRAERQARPRHQPLREAPSASPSLRTPQPRATRRSPAVLSANTRDETPRADGRPAPATRGELDLSVWPPCRHHADGAAKCGHDNLSTPGTSWLRQLDELAAKAAKHLAPRTGGDAPLGAASPGAPSSGRAHAANLPSPPHAPRAASAPAERRRPRRPARALHSPRGAATRSPALNSPLYRSRPGYEMKNFTVFHFTVNFHKNK